MKRKILSLILSLTVALSMIPLCTGFAFATGENFLTFTAQENSTISLSWISGSNVMIKASSDSVTVDSESATTNWQAYNEKTVISLPEGTSVALKGDDVETMDSDHFEMTGKIAASGDVTSLSNGIGGDYTLPEISTEVGAYRSMFSGCTALTSAPNLPITTLENACYYSMFQGCENLITPPTIAATTLDRFCCNEMFMGCKKLETVPELHATLMAYSCYTSMFSGCEKLKAIPDLSAVTTLADGCFSSMFANCKNLETITGFPATTSLEKNCYSGMFLGCEKLKTAPALPIKTLADYCYYGMFEGCKSLKSAPALPATELTEACYKKMFSGCESLETAPALPATELDFSCYEDMFSGCTSLEVAPALPATTMVPLCYCSMFSGCTSLEATPALPATTMAIQCYVMMFKDCTSLKYASALPATTLADLCYAAMFSNCSSLEVSTSGTNPQLTIIDTTAQNPYVFDFTGYGRFGILDGVKLNGTVTSEVDVTVGNKFYWNTGTAESTPTVFIAQGKSNKKSVKYTWSTVEGAKTYKVYQVKCGKKKYKKVKTTSATTFTKKKLKRKTTYKAYVVAYNAAGQAIDQTPIIHNRTKGGSRSNATAVGANANATVKVGSTINVGAAITAKDSKKKLLWKNHVSAPIRYYSADPAVATVDAAGNVTGVAAGVANIYSVAPTGVHAVTKITVEKAEPEVNMVTVSFCNGGNVTAKFTTSGEQDVTGKTLSVPEGCSVEYGDLGSSEQTLTFKKGNDVYEVVKVKYTSGFGWNGKITQPIKGGEVFQTEDIPS